MFESWIEQLDDPFYALSLLATTVSLSCLFHLVAKPVVKEALFSVDADPKHVRHSDRVITNFAKAGCLSFLTMNPLFWYISYQAFYWSKWEHLASTRFVVILYTVTDISSFFTTWMQPRTAFHHAVTGLFAVVTCACQSILELQFARLMLWYGLCSTVTYLVNFFIGTIYCFRTPLRTLASYSALIYAASLAINWVKYIPGVVSMIVDERQFFASLLVDHCSFPSFLTFLLFPWIERLLLVSITSILIHDDIQLLRSLIEYSGGVSSSLKCLLPTHLCKSKRH